MTRSWTEIPHLSAMDELDASALLDARRELTAAGLEVSLAGLFATPVIRPPEAAILGFGAIRNRPFVLADGTLAARPTLPYCLSADHRLIDGDLATAFAEHVASLLTSPVRLLAGHLAR
jgi:pyruvate/2-oxoglutarate dehydrogenase complex dihydrolipoamide acyltransferase (E2) component